MHSNYSKNQSIIARVTKPSRLKGAIKAHIPPCILTMYRRAKLRLETFANRKRSPEEVFTEIYMNNLWGGKPGEFYSGSGTTNPQVNALYCQALSQEAKRFEFQNLTLVDLGCGDMRIGNKIAKLGKKYVGADVVGPLIEQHKKQYSTDKISFHQIDITRDELPEGEICFLRQVLQHLSNKQIISVLPKLERYQQVYITEHIPNPDLLTTPNLDKSHGGEIRLLLHSGVYLHSAPFNLPIEDLEVILEVDAPAITGWPHHPGTVQTIRYTPKR